MYHIRIFFPKPRHSHSSASFLKISKKSLRAYVYIFIYLLALLDSLMKTCVSQLLGVNKAIQINVKMVLYTPEYYILTVYQ